MDKVVEVKKVNKTYTQAETEIRALKDVDLVVEPGELVMVVGPSGSGKTTLISVIAGVLQSDSGEVTVCGKPLHTFSDPAKTKFRKSHVGFLFQEYHLIPSVTAAENVSIPLLIQGRPWKEAIAEARVWLERVELGNRTNDPPYLLSGGQQQRVAIARALVHHPDLVICDEPTAALDANTGAKVMEMMREIVRNTHRSVIVVTHDPRIFDYADRIVEMDDGRIVNHKRRT